LSPITILVDTLKLPGTDLVTPYTDGAQAAADQINAQGGIGGRKVVIMSCNSMYEPAVAVTCARKGVQAHVTAMIGCEPVWGTSGLPILAAAGIPSFNCINTPVDYTAPTSFGLQAGGFGELAGMSHYLCTQSAIHTVVLYAIATPYQQLAPAASKPLTACGKKFYGVYYPITTTDYSPYAAKVAALHPDWVMTEPENGPEGITEFQQLEQNGIPNDHISTSSSSMDYPFLTEGGKVTDGIFGAYEWTSWSDTSDPAVTAYLQATAHVPDNKSSSVETTYGNVMWFYTIAKKIGQTNFNSASLIKFMTDSSNNGTPMELSRQIVIPGPTGFPHQNQPWIQIVQWQNGTLNIIKTGTQDGWVNAFQ
jgi:ABC-type branched-subunit amino acid transport system substrate-binding protein